MDGVAEGVDKHAPACDDLRAERCQLRIPRVQGAQRGGTGIVVVAAAQRHIRRTQKSVALAQNFVVVGFRPAEARGADAGERV